jgi:hypothetical protein
MHSHCVSKIFESRRRDCFHAAITRTTVGSKLTGHYRITPDFPDASRNSNSGSTQVAQFFLIKGSTRATFPNCRWHPWSHLTNKHNDIK